MDRKNLCQRLFSGLILGPIVLFAIYVRPLYLLLLILGLYIGIKEWHEMMHKYEKKQYILGLVAIALSALLLASLPRESAYLLFFIVWATDIAAYFGGSIFGGRKLAPTISPKKTVSGSICGVAASIIVSLIFALCTKHGIGYLVIGLIVSIASQAGDLLMSYFKRKVNIKDTGNLIPGHGGLLDRIDGLLLAVYPFVLLVLIFH